MPFPYKNLSRDTPRMKARPSYVSQFLKDKNIRISTHKLIKSTRAYSGAHPLPRRFAAVLAHALTLVNDEIVASLVSNGLLKDSHSQITAQHLRQALAASHSFRDNASVHIAGTRAPLQIYEEALPLRYRKRMQRRKAKDIPEPKAYRSITFV